MGTQKRRPKEGRVNVPLGGNFDKLSTQASRLGLTKTELARVLIVDGLRDLAAGRITYRKPGLEVAQ